MLQLVYKNEAKHPNFKIVKTMVKEMSFEAPKDDENTSFFPSPKTDGVFFDENGSLPKGYLRNKKDTMILSSGLGTVRNTPQHLRSKACL